VPSADRVTHSDWTYVLLPNPPGCDEHATTNSLVPPAVTFVPMEMIWPIGVLSSSPPLNAVVTLATVAEALVPMLPSVLSAYRTADPWKLVGHPSVVDQVGDNVARPLDGLKRRLPGSEPVTASAAPAVSSPTPAVRPSRLRTTSALTFASRREPRTARVADIAAHGMAKTANSGRTSGEK
jgi:hypothetical protein